MNPIGRPDKQALRLVEAYRPKITGEKKESLVKALEEYIKTFGPLTVTQERIFKEGGLVN